MEHLSFQVERFSDVIEEIKPLLPRHWEELALDKEQVPLAPDWERYAAMDKLDMLVVVTARRNGRVSGYVWMVLSPGIHYCTTLEATMDIFWLVPEVRGRMGGKRMFRAVEKELMRRGVRRIYLGSKLHKDVGRLFIALGYKPIETWYSKILEG